MSKKKQHKKKRPLDTQTISSQTRVRMSADPLAQIHPKKTASKQGTKNQKTLLLVDGYNVLHKSPRYTQVFDNEEVAAVRTPYAGDPFERARGLLIADVAAYAKGRYEAVVIFDAAQNVADERPRLTQAGIRVEFSPCGVTADEVIERYVGEARAQARNVVVVTSDNTIRATVGGIPVTKISSETLIEGVGEDRKAIEATCNVPTRTRFALEDRLDAHTRKKLDALLGRNTLQ